MKMKLPILFFLRYWIKILYSAFSSKRDCVVFINNYTELSPSEGGRIQGGKRVGFAARSAKCHRSSCRRHDCLPLLQINSINRIKRQPSIIALAQSRVAGDRPSHGAMWSNRAIRDTPNTSIFINKHLSGPWCVLASRDTNARCAFIHGTDRRNNSRTFVGGITKNVSESRAPDAIKWSTQTHVEARD